jgi:hypothetical protein
VQAYEACPRDAASDPAETTSHDNALKWIGRGKHKSGFKGGDKYFFVEEIQRVEMNGTGISDRPEKFR